MATSNSVKDTSGLSEPYLSHILAANKLYTTSKYSDLVIKCGDRQWNVHKAVVCPRSEVFAKMCDIGMKESREGVIDLKDDEPYIVGEMLYYLYNFDYDENASGGDDGCPPIVFDVRIHVIADKYDIPALKDLAVKKFATRAEEEWKTEGFALAVQEIYGDAPDTKVKLCKIVIEVCGKHAKEVFTDNCSALLKEVALSVSAFGGELTIYLAGDGSRPGLIEAETFCRYGSCGVTFARTKLVDKGHCEFANFWDTQQYSCPYCNMQNTAFAWEAWEVKWG